MFTLRSSIWQTLAPFLMFAACAMLQSACSCQSAKLLSTNPAACISQHEKLPVAARLESETFAPGFTPYSFGVTDRGVPAVAVELVTPPGRADLTPHLMLQYAGPNNDGVAGNFVLDAASSINRCEKSRNLDGEIDSVHFSEDDAFCWNGQRLVIVAQESETIQYRLWPDAHIKIEAHLENGKHAYFTAYYPSGEIITFGRTSGSRPTAGKIPIAWLADEQRNARGDKLEFGYCFVTESDEIKEFALDEIRYGFSEGTGEPTRAVSLVYGQKDHARMSFEGGYEFKQSLQLDEVQMSVRGSLVRRYALTYDQGETTNRTRLVSLKECAGDNSCKLPTRFHYREDVAQGFEDITTNITKPLSDRASPLLGDFTGDGLADWIVPDTVAFSTTKKPVTEWRLARNNGDGFDAETVALLQEWPVSDVDDTADPSQIQPELGVMVDYDQNGVNDILLYDMTGTRNSHVILRTKSDGTFEEISTQISRPFQIGPAPEGLRSSVGAVHLADVTGDSVDLIQCSDHGDTPETAGLPTWKTHLWRPGGFHPQGAIITALQGYSCASDVITTDVNADGKAELLLPGMIRVNDVPTEPTGTYSVFTRNSDGTWTSKDTRLPLPTNGGRVLFADVNGDSLPDAIMGDTSGRLWTRMNTGEGFVDQPVPSLAWDGLLPQTKYFELAIPGDFNGDSRIDLLMPLIDAISPDVPRWVILQATGGAFTFERVESGIPFEAEISDAVKLADPRMPRVAEVTGDAADDVLVFLGSELHLFKNLGADPDLLVAISDGRNDHDPDDPAFIPNVSITYDHLRDKSDLYVARDDPANGCVYPRHCVVAPMRAVLEYALDAGDGGQRKFGLRYRDGRSDRQTDEFLGFGKRYLVDLDTGETTVDHYDNVTKIKIGERDLYPFVGHIQKQWLWTPGLATQANPEQVEMVFAERTLEVVPTNDNQSYFTLPTRMHTRRMQGSWTGAGTLEAYVTLVDALENATKLRESTVEVADVDEYGNVLEVKVNTEGIDATMHITRTVKNDVGKWMLGLPDTQTECSTGSGLEQCRTISRTVNEFGEVIGESTSSNDGIDDTKLFVTYQRDKYGSVTNARADDAFGHTRESTTEYDNEGFFPRKRINALDQVTIVEYDERFGVLTKEIDPNGLTTESNLDGFGRVTLKMRPDGSSTTITRTREKMDGSWRTKERITTTGGADDEIVVDSLGRSIRTFTHGPEPKANMPRIMQVLEYDRLSGEVAKKSMPIAEGTPITQMRFDEYKFDALGREIRHTTPWDAVTTTRYEGLFVRVRDPLQRTTSTEVDTLGRTKTITDAENGVTTYAYGPFDSLRTVTDPGQDVTIWHRDAFSRVRQLDETNSGTTTFIHNGFGDVESSTDALGRTAAWIFDVLGRTTTRVDTHAGKTLTTAWTWDTAPHGIGRLHSVTSPDGFMTYRYTQRGQTETVKLGVNGDEFASRVHYDDVGRVTALDYPQPLGQAPFGVTYEYDTHGFRIGVHDATTKDAYWLLTDVDAAGRYREEAFGNGTKTLRSYDETKPTLKSITTTHGSSTIQQLAYGWDAVLNLASRTDASQVQNKTERFRYDGLQRLTCAYFSPTENSAAPCATSYGYAANGNMTTKSDMGILQYGDPKHPHAVTHAAGGTYVHDAAGNQIMRPGGVSITYTPVNLPKTITQAGKAASFGYDGDDQRIWKTSALGETLYFEDIFEQVTAGTSREFRYYVQSPERVITIVTRGGNEPGTKYLHVDHLRSIETITNNDGTIAEKRSHDAYGAKRNPKWGEPVGVSSSKVTKGFTGHEEDEEFGLVNMRGRLYDPQIARFTTPDPVIPDLFDGQSFNRFSYVWNNPLTWVDPSGFTPEEPPTVTPAEFVDLVLSQPEAQPQKKEPPVADAAATGTSAPTTDMGTTGVSGAAQTAKEGFGSFIEGLVKGSLSDNDSWSATLGSVVGGFIPGVGLVADIRDLGAAVSHVADGKGGAWFELGASIIGFVPGGDIAKGIAKSAQKAAAKTAVKVGAELADDAAKVIKGSTAAAADGLSSAKKTAGKVHAPRGPPGANGTKRPGTRGHDDHRADVDGAGKRQAKDLARPGEEVRSEQAVRGHPGINRRADNQIVGTDGRTRLVVESERRPGGKYHKTRVKELEAAGIEVITRPPSQWGK